MPNLRQRTNMRERSPSPAQLILNKANLTPEDIFISSNDFNNMNDYKAYSYVVTIFTIFLTLCVFLAGIKIGFWSSLFYQLIFDKIYGKNEDFIYAVISLSTLYFTFKVFTFLSKKWYH